MRPKAREAASVTRRGSEGVSAKTGAGQAVSRAPTKTTRQRRELTAPPKAVARAIAPDRTEARAQANLATT